MVKKRPIKTKIKLVEPEILIDTTPLKGLLLLILALTLFLSLLSFAYGQSHNWLGLVGSTIGWFFHALLGLGSYSVPVFISWLGWRKLFDKPIRHPFLKAFFFSLFTLSVCLFLTVIENADPRLSAFMRETFYPYLWQKKMRYHLGGAPLYYLCYDIDTFNLHHILNTLGVSLLALSLFITSLLYLAKISPFLILRNLSTWWANFKLEFKKQEDKEELHHETTLIETDPYFSQTEETRFSRLKIPPTLLAKPAPTKLLAPPLAHIKPSFNTKLTSPSLIKEIEPSFPSFEEVESSFPIPKQASLSKVELPLVKEEEKLTPPKKREAAVAAQRIYNGDFTNYTLPPPSLLTNAKKVDQSLLKKDLSNQAAVLEETLLSFGIEAKVGQINCGPAITSFEVHPAIGVKVQKIKTLENDIALNMQAKSIRIIAPIPGKAAVGIEVPNAQAQEVSFKELLLSYLQAKKLHVPVFLGKAVNGDNVINDLTKMPHCIIAGATGSGKSVCINTIVMTILMTAKPDEIKLIMVDPKKVELTPYTRLPHMLAPVITEPQGAYAALTWLVKEMESRYEILKLTGVRNIEAFNNRQPNKEVEATLDKPIPERFPFIIGIIDELADLMMVSSHDIETPIARIAQMARAVGIHLILATQRPSREVITGLIKANFPTRISFKVASRINSQIVLDEVGAETLLGNGDMLFLPPGSSHLIRAQGAFIRDEDINAVVKYICDQAPPNYVISSFDKLEYKGDEEEDKNGSSKDSLYQNAVDVVLGTGNASTTFLQRKLKIGYARAASLIDQLEENGIVGPAEGSKARKILVARAGSSSSNAQESELAALNEE